jgi:hypothetical protein
MSIFGLNQLHCGIDFDEMRSLSRKGARLSQQQHALDWHIFVKGSNPRTEPIFDFTALEISGSKAAWQVTISFQMHFCEWPQQWNWMTMVSQREMTGACLVITCDPVFDVSRCKKSWCSLVQNSHKCLTSCHVLNHVHWQNLTTSHRLISKWHLWVMLITKWQEWLAQKNTMSDSTHVFCEWNDALRNRNSKNKQDKTFCKKNSHECLTSFCMLECECDIRSHSHFPWIKQHT